MPTERDIILAIPAIDPTSATYNVDVAAYLNTRPLIPNSEPQGTVSAPITLVELLSLLTPQEVLAVNRINDTSEWLNGLGNSLPSSLTPQDQEILLGKILQLFTAISTTNVGYGQPLPTAVRILINIDHRTALQLVVDILRLSGTISAASETALTTAISSTIPDPDYEPQIPGPPRYEAMGLPGPAWTPERVQEAIS